jgi:hypothetical protein
LVATIGMADGLLYCEGPHSLEMVKDSFLV